MKLTAAQVQKHRSSLEAMERDLVVERAAESDDDVELDQSRVGRLSRMDALQVQAMSRETARRRGQRLQRVRSALARIDSGDYGICLECGEPIPGGRLDIDPSASHCIGCAEEAEG